MYKRQDEEKAKGADIRIVYSVLDALEVAKKNKSKKIIFLGIGFETTAPSSAAGVLKAQMAGIRNFYLFSSHKIMPPAMEALIDEGVKLDGYIAPGHVSTITGTGIYKNIPEKFGLGCVISGFEPVDLRRIVGTAAPNILFPYARECIDNLCVKGGFPPVMLAPINFDAMYQQALEQAQAAPASEPSTH